MNLLKKYFALLLAAAVFLSLSACGGSGDIGGGDDVGGDWRTWGIVRDGGTITRSGEDTFVLVCVNTKESNFYYDTDGQVLFDFVEYPTALADKVALSGDVWSMFKDIDFADLNGDGNSDVTMKFDDSGSELEIVWFWDTENGQYMYQPDRSNIGDADDGRGDIVPDDGADYMVPVLMSDELPFDNMETLRAENYDDGTYYYEDIAEDGLIRVVNTVRPTTFWDNDQTVEDYLTDCALSLAGETPCELQSVEQNDEYTMNMTYPVYIVTYTAGGNEDAREWTVFAMDTDSHTYLYGISATLDAADDMRSVYQDIFAGLCHGSDGE
ncbi:MAG: hypothetical protein ACI4K7_11965 [Oscillospiraceae bacterium]